MSTETQEKEQSPKKEEKTVTENKSENTKTESSDIVKKLKELAELKDMGVINEEEFAQMKARLIENFGK